MHASCWQLSFHGRPRALRAFLYILYLHITPDHRLSISNQSVNMEILQCISPILLFLTYYKQQCPQHHGSTKDESSIYRSAHPETALTVDHRLRPTTCQTENERTFSCLPTRTYVGLLLRNSPMASCAPQGQVLHIRGKNTMSRHVRM